MSLVPWEDAEDLTEEPAVVIEDGRPVAFLNMDVGDRMVALIEYHIENDRCVAMFYSPPRQCLHTRPCPIHD